MVYLFMRTRRCCFRCVITTLNVRFMRFWANKVSDSVTWSLASRRLMWLGSSPRQDANQSPDADDQRRSQAAEYVKPYWSYAPAISLNYWNNQIKGKERLRYWISWDDPTTQTSPRLNLPLHFTLKKKNITKAKTLNMVHMETYNRYIYIEFYITLLPLCVFIKYIQCHCCMFI